MKMIDFMFLGLCKMYSRTNPALIDYTKPQNRAVWTLTVGGIIWLIAAYYFTIVYTINIISYTPATLLIPGIILLALSSFVYYLLYKRYVTRFSKFTNTYNSVTVTQVVWAIILTIAFFILPIILLVRDVNLQIVAKKAI